MIDGTHVVLYSRDAEADRRFLRDVLGWPAVGAAGEDDPWLVFAMPPSELGVHPTDSPPSVGLYLTCSDLDATLAELRDRGVEPLDPPRHESWGTVVTLRLPSGAELGLYQPRHRTPFS